LNRAQKSLSHASPLSIHLIYQQLQASRGLSVADCFRSELNLAVHCCRIGDFKEGVRALLVEKDKNPKWQYTHLEDVKEDVVEQFFEPIWGPKQHPLSHLS
jgi:hypothetical protein